MTIKNENNNNSIPRWVFLALLVVLTSIIGAGVVAQNSDQTRLATIEAQIDIRAEVLEKVSGKLDKVYDIVLRLQESSKKEK